MSTNTSRVSAAPGRAFPHMRAWNIAFRTAHICATCVLLGGDVWGIDAGRLLPWFYLSVLTGAALTVVEIYPDWRWFVEGRGVLVVAKLLVLCLAPWFWGYRVPLLFVVIVIASVGSHMPRMLRHWPVFGWDGRGR
jgi:hypothetical protein